MAVVESEYPIDSANAPRKHERRETKMRCLCERVHASIIGGYDPQSNVRILTMRVECANPECRRQFRAVGINDGTGEDDCYEPCSIDHGITTLIPLVPEDEEPLMVSMQ
jgi:hypothetical protein